MKKFREIFRGGHGSFTTFVIISTVIFFLIIVFKPGNNLINWVKAGHEISRQEKLIRNYRQQMEQMDQRIHLLTSDKDTLEKFAREQFNMAAPGEDVFILEED